MTQKEHELLRGMGNCYASCGENFENTVGMVAHARGLSPDYVKKILQEMKIKYADDSEYNNLRARFPEDFPL